MVGGKQESDITDWNEYGLVPPRLPEGGSQGNAYFITNSKSADGLDTHQESSEKGILGMDPRLPTVVLELGGKGEMPLSSAVN